MYSSLVKFGHFDFIKSLDLAVFLSGTGIFLTTKAGDDVPAFVVKTEMY